MTEKDLIIAIDVGTQSTKALVFDLEGRMLAGELVPYRPYVSPHPGWAEQDPEVYWQALCRACRTLQKDSRADRARIAGLTVTTQRGTVVNLDKHGRLLRPAIVWLDQRQTRGLAPLQGPWGFLFRMVGLKGTIAYLQSQAEVNWIRTHQPDIWRHTHKYLLLSGYLTYRLTGCFYDSIASQIGYIPFDYRRKRWPSPQNWRWQVLPVAPDMLPALRAPGQILGALEKGAAAETGLPEGLPVVAAAADKACEVIGCGGLAADTGCISYGTSATINVTHTRYVEPIRFLPAYPAAVPDRYSLEVQVYRGYWMVSWFKEQFGQPEIARANAAGIEAETLFEELLEKTAPGAMGLVLQPFWSPGLKFPGPEAKGAVIGFGDVHSRAHLYRAIIEGIAYALRHGKERIEKRTGIPVKNIMATGGGSQSDLGLQLTADVFGLPCARPRSVQTSGLGAAINAAVGLGLHSDYDSAVAAMVPKAAYFEPDQAAHRIYTDLYRDVSLKLYRRLKPLYHQIRKITGYP